MSKNQEYTRIVRGTIICTDCKAKIKYDSRIFKIGEDGYHTFEEKHKGHWVQYILISEPLKAQRSI